MARTMPILISENFEFEKGHKHCMAVSSMGYLSLFVQVWNVSRGNN
jgi:hypothetical protein